MTALGLTTLGAAELARRIRAGDTSPLEVVDAHIARIETVEPHINALITTTFDAARTTARRMTEAGVPADPPPLHGVPITVKDALAVAGVRFTAGSDGCASGRDQLRLRAARAAPATPARSRVYSRPGGRRRSCCRRRFDSTPTAWWFGARAAT